MNGKDFEVMKAGLIRLYQIASRAMLKTEKKNLDAPTKDLELECIELRGYMRGIKKAIDLLEARANDTDLFAGVSQ